MAVDDSGYFIMSGFCVAMFDGDRFISEVSHTDCATKEQAQAVALRWNGAKCRTRREHHFRAIETDPDGRMTWRDARPYEGDRNGHGS